MFEPGFEPGFPRPQRAVLTTRRFGQCLRVGVQFHKDDLDIVTFQNVGSSDFPGGPPTKYSPGLAVFSFGVRMGSSICTEA